VTERTQVSHVPHTHTHTARLEKREREKERSDRRTSGHTRSEPQSQKWGRHQIWNVTELAQWILATQWVGSGGRKSKLLAGGKYIRMI